MAKRRTLPEEDLAAAVADMISSPITRANLSFLQSQSNVADSIVEPVGVEEKATGSRVELSARPTGVVENAVAVESKIDDVGVAPRFLEVTSHVPFGSSDNPGVMASGPMGRVEEIGGNEATPLGVTAEPSVVITRPSAALIPRPPAPAKAKAMWQVEQLGTVFEGSSRVRSLQHAREALSAVERLVYDLLWNAAGQQREDFRLVQFSLQRIANEARINIRTARELMPRLVSKGFVEVAAEADVRRNIPTTYRIWGFGAILERLHRQQRFYVARTGKGVFYVHPIQATVVPLTAEDGITPMGLIVNTRRQQPMGSVSSRSQGPENSVNRVIPPLKPMGQELLNPGGSGNPDSMGLSIKAPLGLENPKPREDQRQQPVGVDWPDGEGKLFGVLSAICEAAFGYAPDRELLIATVEACHERAVETIGRKAEDDELIYFASVRADAIQKAANIRNHMLVFSRALPDSFSGAAFLAYREAAQSHPEPSGR